MRAVVKHLYIFGLYFLLRFRLDDRLITLNHQVSHKIKLQTIIKVNKAKDCLISHC